MEEQPGLFQRVASWPNLLRSVLIGAGVITMVTLTTLLVLSRREVKSLRTEDSDGDEQEGNDT